MNDYGGVGNGVTLKHVGLDPSLTRQSVSVGPES